MSKQSKRMQDNYKLVATDQVYKLEQAVDLLHKTKSPKFDQTFNVSLRMGIDPKKSDQNVRGTVSLPHGTGKKTRVIVIAKGEKAKEAEAAGADQVGADDLIEKIKEGWTDFESLVTTPDMMKELAKLAKILGPRGLMPNPKLGTVTTDVTKAVKELKAGKIEFKADKTANINCPVGKFSFNSGSLVDNVNSLIQAIVKAKPATAKGVYIRSMYLSTTMGLGLKIDLTSIATA